MKYATEKIGKFDRKALADDAARHDDQRRGRAGHPDGRTWDENGDIDRMSFLAEVVNGKQKITQELPKLK